VLALDGPAVYHSNMDDIEWASRKGNVVSRLGRKGVWTADGRVEGEGTSFGVTCFEDGEVCSALDKVESR
jgi:hypothetical protein